jgi:hypothetical protein
VESRARDRCHRSPWSIRDSLLPPREVRSHREKAGCEKGGEGLAGASKSELEAEGRHRSPRHSRPEPPRHDRALSSAARRHRRWRRASTRRLRRPIGGGCHELAIDTTGARDGHEAVFSRRVKAALIERSQAVRRAWSGLHQAAEGDGGRLGGSEQERARGRRPTQVRSTGREKRPKADTGPARAASLTDRER